jgi:hypothetical protein
MIRKRLSSGAEAPVDPARDHVAIVFVLDGLSILVFQPRAAQE